MKLMFKLSELSHLTEKSCYNNNYYMLPFDIDGTNIVYEHCDEEYDVNTYYLIYRDNSKKLVFQDQYEIDPIVEIEIINNKIKEEAPWT